MPSRNRIALVATLLPVLAACSGFPHPDAVSRHVGGVTGVVYTREGGLTIGSTAMRLARVGVAAGGEQSPRLLEDLRDVRVGLYRAETRAEGRRLADDDFRRYSVVLRLQVAGGEDLMLLSRGSRGRIRELLALISGVEQLTVVQVRGDLEGLLEEAVRLALNRADRRDLEAPVLRSLRERRGEID